MRTPALKARWDRIDEALSQGLDLKRRVIEDLRPTLLDNMGLFAALRWLATERCGAGATGAGDGRAGRGDQHRAGYRAGHLPHRAGSHRQCRQHAGASALKLKATVGASLVLEIADDGRGMPADADTHVGSHGLKQMRFRMEAVGGDLQIRQRTPSGTSIVLSVPLGKGAASAAPA